MERYIVPNQRRIYVNKEAANSQSIENYYATVNLLALENASTRLQTKAGFKLWTYIAKNQNKYSFALSKMDFCQWSGCARNAYNSGFAELVEQGFLVEETKNNFIFHEYPRKHKEENNSMVMIKIPEKKVEEIRKIEDTFCIV